MSPLRRRLRRRVRGHSTDLKPIEPQDKFFNAVLEAKDLTGKTPYLQAIYSCHFEIVEELCLRGAKINICDSNKNYPLEIARLLGKENGQKMTKLLKKQIKNKSKWEKSQKEISKLSRNAEKIEKLQKIGKKLPSAIVAVAKKPEIGQNGKSGADRGGRG